VSNTEGMAEFVGGGYVRRIFGEDGVTPCMTCGADDLSEI